MPWIIACAVATVAAVLLTTMRSAAESRLTDSSLRMQVTPGSRIALLGDSLAVGLDPFLKQFAAAGGVAYQAEGHVGTTPRQWATHDRACGTCGTWVTSFRPTHAIVVLGTNDIGQPHPQKVYYEQIRDALRAVGAHVVWVSPPPMKKGIEAVRALIDQLGVDVFHSELVTGLLPSADGVHPGGNGYAIWATALWQSLRSA